MFYKNVAPKKFSNLTRKHLCRRLFFYKILGWSHATLWKLCQRHFPLNFVKSLTTSTLLNACELLLLWILMRDKRQYGEYVLFLFILYLYLICIITNVQFAKNKLRLALRINTARLMKVRSKSIMCIT